MSLLEGLVWEGQLSLLPRVTILDHMPRNGDAWRSVGGVLTPSYGPFDAD
jgi:hypothetical protein